MQLNRRAAGFYLAILFAAHHACAAPSPLAAQGLDALTGRGVPVDTTRGLDLCRRAAATGDALAEYCLGLAYGQGFGGT